MTRDTSRASGRPAEAAPGVATPDFVTPPERLLTGEELREVDPSPRFRIGEVAERIGLSLRSIRYYEESGLVTPAGRTSGGFRMYSEADVQRLLGIMQMKPLGFSLERMGEVLDDLDVVRDASASEGERRAAGSRLTTLSAEMHTALANLAQQLEVARQFSRHLDEELDVREPAGGTARTE